MTTTALSQVKPPRDGLLYDSQWVNIVNHDNAYRGWGVEGAVNHAVKATLDAVKSNIESALASAEPVAWRDDVKTVVNWIFGTVGKIENVQLLTDAVVKATRRLESNLAAQPAAKVEALAAGAEYDFQSIAQTVVAYIDEKYGRGIPIRWIEEALTVSLPMAEPTPASVPDEISELRIVAKRNLASMINRGSFDKELMLKCLEELS